MDAENQKNFPIQWGGYYAIPTQEDRFKVFRLLDFTVHAQHNALYRELFEAIPTLEEIKALKPFIGHAPLSAKDLYHNNATLIGADPLQKEDLQGYGIYLDSCGCTQEYIDKLFTDLLHNSRLGPLMVQLHIADDQLQITRI